MRMTSAVPSSHVTCCDIAKGDSGTEGDASTWIIATHDAGRIISDRIETCDGLAFAFQNLGIFIGFQSSKRTKIADEELHGIERATFNGGHARVWFVFRVSQ